MRTRHQAEEGGKHAICLCAYIMYNQTLPPHVPSAPGTPQERNQSSHMVSHSAGSMPILPLNCMPLAALADVCTQRSSGEERTTCEHSVSHSLLPDGRSTRRQNPAMHAPTAGAGRGACKSPRSQCLLSIPSLCPPLHPAVAVLVVQFTTRESQPSHAHTHSLSLIEACPQTFSPAPVSGGSHGRSDVAAHPGSA